MNTLNKLIRGHNVAFFCKMQISNYANVAFLCGLLICLVPMLASAQTSTGKSKVPDWALPGSSTHKQVPPPMDFHRATRTSFKPIGIFKGQSDVGAALAAGASSYDPAKKQYTITSAGYNVWYTRDEFRYLWKKMSGDISFAANVDFPDSAGYGDRKAIIVIRQTLDDDSKEAMVALHGGGLLHLAWRAEQGQNIKEMRVDIASLAKDLKNAATGVVHAKRIGIEKHGDEFSVFVSIAGEPMHRYGNPITLHLDGPFYVGIGFCSHQPDKIDTAILFDVLLKNKPAEVK